MEYDKTRPRPHVMRIKFVSFTHGVLSEDVTNFLHHGGSPCLEGAFGGCGGLLQHDAM
jgi:hypothetical protein